MSGRADLNRRPLGPEPSALAGLSHAPNKCDYTRPSPNLQAVAALPPHLRTRLRTRRAHFTHNHENCAHIWYNQPVERPASVKPTPQKLKHILNHSFFMEEVNQ